MLLPAFITTKSCGLAVAGAGAGASGTVNTGSRFGGKINIVNKKKYFQLSTNFKLPSANIRKSNKQLNFLKVQN
jgi:hypothetical protein